MAGYNGYSKSNNAIQAEIEGKYPKSVLAKMIGVEAGAIEALVPWCEWHHTSSMYNKTYYYDYETAMEMIDKLRAWQNPNQAAKHENCHVEWLEWSGSRNRPKCTEHSADGCTVEFNGKSTYKITFSDGKTMTKRVGTNGFSFREEAK